MSDPETPRSDPEVAEARSAVKHGSALDGVPAQVLRKLERDIREQENLIQGFQKENERLTSELKSAKIAIHTANAALIKRNEELEENVRNLTREVTQLRDIGTEESAHQRALTLQTQLDMFQATAKEREQELRIELDRLRAAKREMEARMAGVDLQKMEEEGRLLQQMDVQMHNMRADYEEEIQRLRSKLQWYVENQEVLTKNDAKMKDMAETIHMLQEKLDTKTGDSEQPSEAASPALARKEAKRIKELEKQVEELEGNLKRRHPDAISELIRATKPSAQEVSEIAFLRDRVKQFEEQDRQVDEEVEKALRVLRQEHERSVLQYEKRLSEMKENVIQGGSPSRHGEPEKPAAARIRELEKQCDHLHTMYRKKIKDLELKLTEAKRTVSAQQTVSNTVAMADMEKEYVARVRKQEDMFSQKIRVLEREMAAKDSQIREYEEMRGISERALQKQLVDTREELNRLKLKAADDEAYARQEYELSNHKQRESVDMIEMLKRQLAETQQALVREREEHNRGASMLRQSETDFGKLKREMDSLKEKMEGATTIAMKEAELRTRLATSEAARIAQVQQQEAILSELRLDYERRLAQLSAQVSNLQIRPPKLDVAVQAVPREGATHLEEAYTRAQKQIASLMEHISVLEDRAQAVTQDPLAVRLRELERMLWDAEQKATRREEELLRAVALAQQSTESMAQELETHHRRAMRVKDMQIERFREELESLMTAAAKAMEASPKPVLR